MMYLITGMPGNGKTLYAVDFIRQERGKGREVYSDIKGLLVEGVQPAPDDWRTLPDGSLVVYDEAHKRFPSYRGKGRSPLELVRDMDEHRHRGIDLMFITQWPDKVDGELFRLIGTHWHLNRAFGLQKANLTMFSRAVMNPYSNLARKGADESLWDFPKDAYALYKSSSLHTDSHKFKLPVKVRNALMSVPFIIAVLWGFVYFMKAQMGVSESAERSEAEPTRSKPASTATAFDVVQAPPTSDGPVLNAGVGTYAALNTEPATSLAGCVSSERGCRCFNTDGFQIDMSKFQCELLLEKPLPFNVYHEYKAPAGSSSERSARGTEQGQGGGSVIGYQPGQRADQFARSPAYTGETWTGPTTTL